MKKIFIDCDPGIDDFVAILAALAAPELEVVGLTSVAGNMPLETTTMNIGKVLEIAGREEVPYGKGAAAPIVGKSVTAEDVHGKSGLGSLELPKPKLNPVNMEGHKFLYDSIKENSGNIILLAIGPLTNVAYVINEYPDIKSMIEKIVIMGGGCDKGNVTEKAEFNIYADPHAAHIVFNSGIPIDMIGLDATMDVGLTEKDCKEICSESKIGQAIFTLMKDHILFNTNFGNGSFAFMHDLTALASTIYPQAFKMKKCHVDIELKNKETLGQTICRVDNINGKKHNATVAMGVYEKEFMAAVTELISRL